MRQAIKRTLLLVGPDGAGKTSVLEHLADRAAAERVALVHVHSRPGLIGGRSASGPVTDPHAEPAWPAVLGAAKVAMILADNLVGAARWRFRRAGGLMVVERGWHDMTVDPRRYRLSPHLGWLVEQLGRFVPRADVVALLTAEPDVIVARKPELPAAEIVRQIERWRGVLPKAGRRVISIDTGDLSAEQCAVAIWNALDARRWRRVMPAPARLDLRATGRPSGALAVYRPQNRGAKVAGGMSRFSARAGIGRTASNPVDNLDELLAMLGLSAGGIVAMRSSAANRWVLSTDGANGGVVLKIGDASDDALQNEAEFLRRALHSNVFRMPALCFAGPWRDHFVVVTRRVLPVRRRPTSIDDVAAICTAMVRGDHAGPVRHGDLAPWNLLRDESGLVVLDWEFARTERAPLWDLAHHVIQGGALLGRYSATDAVSLLVDQGAVGWQHLVDVGERGEEARSFLGRYLDAARPSEQRAQRYLAEVRVLAGGRARS